MVSSPSIGGKTLMQRKKFFGLVPFALKAGIQSPANLRLPLRVVLSGTPAQILSQFQTFLNGKNINGLF